MKHLVVYKGRTNIVPVSTGLDLSGDVLQSQIREQRRQDSELIATWTVSFATDGTDGELILTLDNSVTAGITKSNGWMDIKRITGGEPINLFDDALEVLFTDTVTQ